MTGFMMCFIFFFKQKTAYEMLISDWSSDVCSSDLLNGFGAPGLAQAEQLHGQEMSYNNYVDTDAARRAANAFTEPAVAIIKQIGRASCRERVCHYVSISWVAVSLKKNKQNKNQYLLSMHIICG